MAINVGDISTCGDLNLNDAGRDITQVLNNNFCDLEQLRTLLKNDDLSDKIDVLETSLKNKDNDKVSSIIKYLFKVADGAMSKYIATVLIKNFS